MSGRPIEPRVRLLNVDVDVTGTFDRAALIAGLGDAIVVLRNDQSAAGESALSFELGADATLPLTVKRLIELVHGLPATARSAWNQASRRVFDIGIQAGLEPHQTTWSLGAELVGDLAAIGAEIVVTVYGASVSSVVSSPPSPVSYPSLRRSAATLFDAYVFCDWSANAAPKSGPDSLWLCRARYADNGELAWELANPRTRREAAGILRAWLVEGVEANERTLAGFDFSFGLPEIAYDRFGVTGWYEYWEYLHARITEGPKNENNRFEVARGLNRSAARVGGGPFWGVPPAAADAHLRATKPPADAAFPEYRVIETTLRAKKYRPFSAWQLLGNGSVGSQALVGIPVLEALRTDPVLRPHTRVWPFETGPGRVVLAEVWPSLVDVDLGRHAVRDAAQMIALGAWAAAEDLAGRLAAHLAAPDREPRARAEGWVLGMP